jgi:bifunctional non-homologous end joining protein LigD
VVTHPFEHPDWIFETKLDGYRAIAVINSRRSSALVSQSLTTRTDVSEGPRGDKQAKVRSTILDGEIVALDDWGIPRFQLVQQLQKRPTASSTVSELVVSWPFLFPAS